MIGRIGTHWVSGILIEKSMGKSGKIISMECWFTPKLAEEFFRRTADPGAISADFRPVRTMNKPTTHSLEKSTRRPSAG